MVREMGPLSSCVCQRPNFQLGGAIEPLTSPRTPQLGSRALQPPGAHTHGQSTGERGVNNRARQRRHPNVIADSFARLASYATMIFSQGASSSAKAKADESLVPISTHVISWPTSAQLAGASGPPRFLSWLPQRGQFKGSSSSMKHSKILCRMSPA